MSLESLNAIKKDMESAFEAAQKELSKNVLAALQDIPHVKAIRVKQYTPGFNDGEPCTNSMCDLEALIEGVPADGDGWILGCYLDKDDVPNMSAGDIKDVKGKLNKLSQAIEGLEDVFERTFQTNQQITFYKDGKVEVEEYDCGH